jgi:UDP-N-acetylmuramoyl-L-alanyl-D-glutamate--2,6-diaminopimelate ligase
MNSVKGRGDRRNGIAAANDPFPHSMNQGKEAADMPQTANCADGVSLRAVCPEARLFGGEDIRIRSCCGDARSCRPGDLYVAVVAPDTDGHDHDQITEAVRRGAAAVLTESYLPVRVPQAVVTDSREAYGRICQRLVGNPSDAMHLVGVTGTNGKTTTALLTASVLRAAKMHTGFTGSLVHSDSTESAPAKRTTPAPPEMANWLLRMVNNGCTHAVIEASSRGLAQRRTAGLTFDAAVITNLRRDHVDYHGSVTNYRKAKERLLEQLRPAGFAVLNADDAGCQLLLPKIECPAITFGMNQPAEVMGSVIERCPSEQTFLLTAGNEAVPVRTRIIGDQHIANCLAAAAVGLVYGAELTVIARGLEAIERVPNRLDRVECGQSFHAFVDCADTADRLATTLQTLKAVTRGRVICAFGVDDRGAADERPLLGRALERFADVAVLTDGPFGNAEPLQVTHDLLDGYQRAAKAHVMPNRRRAIAWALSQARAGDTVLVAGSDRRNVELDSKPSKHSDVGIVRDWLYKSAAKDGTKVFSRANMG